ncbi:hypothetical protein D3C76_1555640 [compost metagenome]
MVVGVPMDKIVLVFNKADGPKVGETRTMIYVYNEKNNHTAHGIVVTNNGKLISWSGLKSYY